MPDEELAEQSSPTEGVPSAGEMVILRALLDGDDPVLETLRVQLQEAKVTAREWTGVGFFTYFELPPWTSPLMGEPNFDLHDVAGNWGNTLCSFILFVRSGRLAFLEGCTYGPGDAMDPDAEPSELSYLSGGRADSSERNLDALRQDWAQATRRKEDAEAGTQVTPACGLLD